MNADKVDKDFAPACNKVNRSRARFGTYGSWESMKSRCLNPRHVCFKDYGGRGITVCEKWLSFDGFYEDMNSSWRPGLSIERKNNDLGYFKANCRWATPLEQGQNKRTNVVLEFSGERLTVSAWARRLGCWKTTLYKRIKLGWSTERILTIAITSRLRR